MENKKNSEFIGNVCYARIKEKYLQSHDKKEWYLLLNALGGLKRIYYDDLPNILTAAGIELRDIIEIEWPDEQFAKVAALCENMSDNVLSVLYSDLQLLVSQRLVELDAVNPTDRVWAAWKAIYAVEDDGKQNKSTQSELFKMSGMHVTLDKMVDVSKILHLSLHWILNQDTSVPLYTKRAIIDQILVQFSFASKEIKDSFLYALRIFASTIEIRGGNSAEVE